MDRGPRDHVPRERVLALGVVALAVRLDHGVRGDRERELRDDELFERPPRNVDALPEATRREEDRVDRLGEPIQEGRPAAPVALGEHEPAETALRESLHILIDLDSQYQAAKTLVSLVKLELESGPKAATQAQLSTAIKTFTTLGAEADLTEALILEKHLSPT